MKNKIEVQHTPTPWHSEDQKLMAKGITIAIGSATKFADAAFIVKAVNCHEELLRAARMGAAMLLRNTLQDSEDTAAYHALKQALAKAEGV